MMTYAEYADSRSITKQAVYQYIKKHPKDFKGHIQMNEKRTKVLDDEAIEILDKNIRKPVFEQQLIVDNAAIQFHNGELLKEEQEKNELRQKIIDETTKTRELVLAQVQEMFENTATKEDLEQIKEDLIETKKQNIELQEQTKLLLEMLTAMREEKKPRKHRILTFLNKD